MNKQELKNLLYNHKFIAGGDYDKENPFVGIWLDDLVEIINEIITNDTKFSRTDDPMS